MEKLNLNFRGQLAQSFDPVEHEKTRAETFNKKPGNLTGYNCPECLNRGQIAIVKEGGGVSFRECECMKIRRCVTKMEASGLRDVIAKYTFDAYKDQEQWQKIVKQGAMSYADNLTGWLLFCGQSGSGKTHLCTAVCRQRLLDGDEVIYMPWRKETMELKSMDNRVNALKKLQTAPILYIDDLFKVGRSADGSCNPTAADINIAFDIINERYTKRLSTIISTERTPTELVEIDEAIGGRIVEMAQGSIYSIERKPGRNYRLRGVVTV